jgi:hypothetical protein
MASRGKGTHIQGTVYLLHFAVPYVPAYQEPGKRPQCAQHYLGWSSDLVTRLTAHTNGTGANLVRVINEAGISWELARLWEGDRFLERRLKNRGGRARLCPICRGEGTAIAWQQTSMSGIGAA